MTKPFSNDRRERAMTRVSSGETIRASGGVADQSVLRVEIVTRLRQTGSVPPGNLSGVPRKLNVNRS
jgi:hypothetical protein